MANLLFRRWMNRHLGRHIALGAPDTGVTSYWTYATLVHQGSILFTNQTTFGVYSASNMQEISQAGGGSIGELTQFSPGAGNQRPRIDTILDGVVSSGTGVTQVFVDPSGFPGKSRIQTQTDTEANANIVFPNVTTVVGQQIRGLLLMTATATHPGGDAATINTNMYPWAYYDFPINQDITGETVTAVVPSTGLIEF